MKYTGTDRYWKIKKKKKKLRRIDRVVGNYLPWNRTSPSRTVKLTCDDDDDEQFQKKFKIYNALKSYLTVSFKWEFIQKIHYIIQLNGV